MHRTESIEIIEKLSIISQFYVSLQEQDLQQFTHQQLRKLSIVLAKLDPTLLEGQNKKINDILTQRSYGHIKSFLNKYKGFQFNITNFQNSHHKKLLQKKLKNNHSLQNEISNTIGVTDIKPFDDILNKSLKSAETPLYKNQTSGQRIKTQKINHQHQSKQNVQIPLDIIKAKNQNKSQGQRNHPQDNLSGETVAQIRKNRKWNDLTSDDEDYADAQDLQNQQEYKNQIEYQNTERVKQTQASFQSFQVGSIKNPLEEDEQNDAQIILNEKQKQHIQGNLELKSVDGKILSQFQEINDQSQILRKIILESQQHRENMQAILPQEDPERQVSDVQSYELENRNDEQLQALKQWAQANKKSQEPLQNPLNNLLESNDSSIESFQINREEDQEEDYEEINKKIIQEQTNKQIHPTLRHFHQENEQNIRNPNHNTHINRRLNQQKPKNGSDYIVQREWR